MALVRQQLIALSVVFVVLFAGTLALVIDNTRNYLVEQLHSHAQDAATVLGLSLAPALGSGDLPLTKTMVNAIFDPGYYREITIRGADGSELIQRVVPVRFPGVPQWFIRLIDLEAPAGQRELMAGWKQVGTITVVSHPGYAYRGLWSVAVDALCWFLGVFLVVALLVALWARRSVVRSLRAAEN